MKKYLVALAALAIVFAGCKPTEETSEYTKISFKQTEITMAVGESQKLNVLYEPTSLEAPACEWSTSNPEVATVANGTVTAVATGEANITAKVGELTAVCKVTVKSVYGVYQIEDYGVFGNAASSFVEGSDTTINLSWAGGAFNCRLGYWPVLAWDGDVTYVSGSGFQGKGFLMYATVPFYTIDDPAAGDYNGYPFGWGSFALKDTKGQAIRNIGEAGAINEAVYNEYMDSYITELLNDGDGTNIKWDLLDQAITGAIIFVADYTTDDASWSYSDNGLVYSVVKNMELYWDGDSETFSYVADIDWFNNLEEDRFFGLKFGEEGVVKPYDLSIISEHYELDYAALAPATNEPKMITKRYNEMPQIRMGRKVANDILIKK